MTLPNPIRAEIEALTTFRLAYEIDCTSPDSPTSPGASMLDSVRTSTLEAIDYLDTDDLFNLPDSLDDEMNEIADGAVSIYTAEKWSQFTDLAAWTEDIDGYGEIKDMDQGATLALYSIADRLTRWIAQDVADRLSAAVDSATEHAEEIGAEHGQNAAGWWEQDNIGGRTTGDVTDVARSVLEGLDNGDPAIELPSADLSGQWADGVTVSSLLAETDLAGLDLACSVAQEIGDAYTEAFDTACQNAISTACLAVLSDD